MCVVVLDVNVNFMLMAAVFIAQAWGSSHHFQVAVAISSLPLHHHTQVVAPSGSAFLIN